jgi:cell division transport system permease protein
MERVKQFRRKISYFPAFFSISLVLFLSGLFGLFIIHAGSLKDYIKENVQLSIYFKDNVNTADIISLQKKLQSEPYVKSSRFVSKEDGLKLLDDELGANQEDILGYNPVPNTVDVFFNPGYVALDSLGKLKTELEKNINIREVSYPTPVVQNIDRNVRIAAIVLLSMALLMSLVSIALINNTIRLTLYSKRFIIKSMQLVGATRIFIRKPFILRGAVLGLCSSIFACCLLIGVLYTVNTHLIDLSQITNPLYIAALMVVILIVGILISALSSYFAVNRYLRLKLDELF